MNKKISLGVAITFMAVIATITFAITMLFSKRVFNELIAGSGQRENMTQKIAQMDKLLRNNFLFEINNEQLNDGIANGLMESLDDNYASYLSKEEYERYLQNNKGELVGIGVQVKRDATSGYLIVTEVYKDTPAEFAGMQIGDMIMKIDEQDISEMEQSEAVNLIYGKAGMRVKLEGKRGGTDISFEMQRKNIQLSSIHTKTIENYTYIGIETFNNATPDQFKQAIEQAQKQETQGFIFDLRDNSGGTLESVVAMLDYLLPQGVIATQENAKGEIRVIGESDAQQVDLPMVMLTNGRTASASELFVSALKDYDKAKSVGTKTYGKGVMQTTYALSDGSAIRFTTAYFNPPKSPNFNKIGIKADYEVLLSAEQEKSLNKMDEQSDLQLIKALEVLSSKSFSPAS